MRTATRWILPTLALAGALSRCSHAQIPGLAPTPPMGWNSWNTVSVRFSDIGLGHTATVRDLWEKKDRGSFQDSFTTDVPEHGVVLVRIH